MIPFRKPLLRTFKTTMACSMYLIPSQNSTVLQGPGSIGKLPALIQSQGIQKPLVITDRVLMERNLPGSLFEAFQAIGMRYAVYAARFAEPLD